MRVGSYVKTLSVVLGLLGGLAGCRGKGLSVVAPTRSETAPAAAVAGSAALSASPEQLEFTHLIGKSACPQVIGEITVRNTGSARGTASVQVEAPLALRGEGQFVTTRSVSVDASGSVSVQVFFDCGRRSDFKGSVTVSDGAKTVATTTVVGHVR